jgi:hypothetical protein
MQEQTVKLEVSVNDLNIILAGVAKLPIEAAYGAFTNIQKQAEQQLGKPNSNQLTGPLSNKVLN